jgi:hypothetical protein
VKVDSLPVPRPVDGEIMCTVKVFFVV